MNKTIKFRCYYKRDKKYIPLTGISLATNEVIVDQNIDQIIPIDDVILEQFTGLPDINDREIYDGDIVSWVDSDGNTREDVVQRSNGGFCLCDNQYTLGSHGDLEIIGNIHDNEDLS